MPIVSITTTAQDVFFGGGNLDSLNFKNSAAAGTMYLRNKQIRNNTVTSTDFEWSLSPGGTIGLTKVNDGEGIIGPWQAISSEAGGINLEILPIYKPGTARR